MPKRSSSVTTSNTGTIVFAIGASALVIGGLIALEQSSKPATQVADGFTTGGTMEGEILSRDDCRERFDASTCSRMFGDTVAMAEPPPPASAEKPVATAAAEPAASRPAGSSGGGGFTHILLVNNSSGGGYSSYPVSNTGSGYTAHTTSGPVALNTNRTGRVTLPASTAATFRAQPVRTVYPRTLDRRPTLPTVRPAQPATPTGLGRPAPRPYPSGSVQTTTTRGGFGTTASGMSSSSSSS